MKVPKEDGIVTHNGNMEHQVFVKAH